MKNSPFILEVFRRLRSKLEKLSTREQLIRRTSKRFADAHDSCHQNINLARFDPLNIPKTQISQFRKALLRKPFEITFPADVCPESFLQRGQFDLCRHVSLGSKNGLDCNAVLRRSLRRTISAPQDVLCSLGE